MLELNKSDKEAMRLFKKISDYFFGYDFFISYARNDASNYALELADKLGEKKFSCFLDQWGTLAGKELPSKLVRTINSSKYLIVIGSNSALNSLPIKKEIECFKKKENILPISLGNIHNAIWFQEIEGIALSIEDVEQFMSGTIAKPILKRIETAFKYKKQTQRIKTNNIRSIALIIFMLAVMIYSFYQIKYNNNQINKLAEERDIQSSNLSKLTDSVESQQSVLDSIDDQILLMNSLIKDQSDSIKVADQYIGLLNFAVDTINYEVFRIFDYIETKAYQIYRNPDLSSLDLKRLNKSVYVYFRGDHTNLRPEAKEILNGFAQFVKRNPQLKFEIIGHTDDGRIDSTSFQILNRNISLVYLTSSSESYSLKLSENTAKSVFSYLVGDCDLPERNFKLRYSGESDPIFDVGFFNHMVEIKMIN